MDIVATIGALIFWVCVAAVVYPFRPFLTRRRAGVAVVATFLVMIGVLAIQRPPSADLSLVTPTSPSPIPRKQAQRPAIWWAPRTTVACRTIRSAEGFAFLDALGVSDGLRNPKSDPSQTDCRHVAKSTRFARGDRRVSEHLDEVWFAGDGPFYMLSTDVVPAGSAK